MKITITDDDGTVIENRENVNGIVGVLHCKDDITGVILQNVSASDMCFSANVLQHYADEKINKMLKDRTIE